MTTAATLKESAGAVCPNCSSARTMSCPGGRLLPFFVKRVFGFEPPSLAVFIPDRLHPYLGWADRLANATPWGYRPLRCDILICSDCDFVCPALDLTDSQILRLYLDYRSRSYNDERVRYEPQYRKVAPYVGKSPTEQKARMAHVESFLADVPFLASARDVLDFAGADGRFIPPKLLTRCKCTVCDVSDEPPYTPDVCREADLALLGKFDYVQACHVLEHVREPKLLVEALASHLSQNGVLYLEVPQEGSGEKIERLRRGEGSFPIHEHINLYTEKSMAALVESAGLKLLKIVASALNLGWCRTTVISVVASRFPSSPTAS
jgi:SAM-dependent methyltransferase